jgi:GntR family transcriptional regulator, transcriptional repressor for pyruvate dehydrogenase complex
MMTQIEKIRRLKVFEEVAVRLQAWIRDELVPGDRLPTERELVDRFGVGRSSIRDAIRLLQQDGLVETRHGLGTVVAEPVQHLAAAPLASALKGCDFAVAELMDFRRILEPSLAAQAAVRATATDCAVLREILNRQEAKVRQKLPTVEEDTQFHYALACAVKNSVVLKLLDTLMNLLFVTREELFQSETRSRRSLAGHRAIFKAIEDGDAAEANAAMQLHLDRVEALIVSTCQPEKAVPNARKKAQS